MKSPVSLIRSFRSVSVCVCLLIMLASCSGPARKPDPDKQYITETERVPACPALPLIQPVKAPEPPATPTIKASLEWARRTRAALDEANNQLLFLKQDLLALGCEYGGRDANDDQ